MPSPIASMPPSSASPKPSSGHGVTLAILIVLVVLSLVGTGLLYMSLQQTVSAARATQSAVAGYASSFDEIGTTIHRIEEAQNEQKETPVLPVGIEVQVLGGGPKTIYPRAADWSAGAEVKDSETGSLYVKSPDGKFLPEGTDQGARSEMAPGTP